MPVGAGGLGVARRRSGPDRHPPGRRPRPRLLAVRAAEHRLLRAAGHAPAEGPQRVHAAALGLLLRSVVTVMLLMFFIIIKCYLLFLMFFIVIHSFSFNKLLLNDWLVFKVTLYIY